MPSDKWVEIRDFSPGIFGDIHGGIAGSSRGSLPANGAATIDGTFRCGSDQFGSLVPLPAATTVKTTQLLPGLDNAQATTSYYPASMTAAYLVDALTIGPYSTTFDWPLANRNLEGKLLHAVCWFMMYSPTGSGTDYRALYLCRVYSDEAPIDILWESSYSTVYTAGFPHQIPTMNMTAHRLGSILNSTEAAPNPHSGITVAFSGDFVHTGTSTNINANETPLTTFETDMSDNPNPLMYPISRITSGGNQGKFGTWLIWPSTTTFAPQTVFNQKNSYDLPTFVADDGDQTDTVIAPNTQFGSAIRPVATISHQGRIVVMCHRLKGMSRGFRAQTTYLFYHKPFQLTTARKTATFYGENNSDGQLVASLNVDELLVIRNSDGGVLIRGDIDNPSVVRLRNLESMYGVGMTPINTPLGLVYGTPNGVFVYQGGEVAVKLSEQIEGFFWNHKAAADPEYESHRARFGLFHHWICVANNFVYDMRTKSWWRLSDPADRNGVAYNCYTSDPTSGDLFAFPYKVTNTQNVINDKFTKDILASSYSWQSQPLVETLDRTQSFQEVMLVASTGANTAQCQVTITLNGFDADGDPVAQRDVIFSIQGNGNGQPIIQRKSIIDNFNAMYVQVKISAVATSGAAPKIHSVRLGHADRARMPRS